MNNLYSLSSREIDVVELLLKGKSNNQIAQALSISTSTVEFHLSNIYTKLGVNSRTEAVLKLSEHNLGKSIDAFSEKPKESIVDETSNPTDNDGQTSSRSTPMKLIKYIISGAFVTSIIFLVLFTNTQSKSLASTSTSTISTEALSTTVAIASPTPKVESCIDIHEVMFCVKGTALTKDILYVMLEINTPPGIQGDVLGFMLPSVLEGEIKPTLTDDQGNVYNTVDNANSLIVFPGSDSQTYQQTMKFPRSDHNAKFATLMFPAVVTYIPLQSSFLLDLGENPQPGQVISLDQTLNIQEQEIHLTRAELSGDGINSLHIDIWSDPVSFRGDMVAIMLDLGIPEGSNMGTGFGSKMILPNSHYHIFAELTRPGMQPVSGVVSIPVNGVRSYYQGDFEIPFSISESGLHSDIKPTLDQLAHIAEIRRFADNPSLEITFITFEYVNNTVWSALYFTKDGSKYWVETQTRRIVQFENGAAKELTSNNNKSPDEIRNIAERFVSTNSLKFQKYYSDLVLSEKIENNLFVYRWENLKIAIPEVESPFVQVVISQDGNLVGFTNILDFFEP